MSHIRLLAIAIITLSTVGASGQRGPVGVAPDRIARIDALLQRYVDENRIAGAVALVLRDGKPMYERAVGWSDKEASRRMTPDTVFRIASQTKAITSAAILVLLEEGRLGLTSPASEFIPEFDKTMVAVQSDGGAASGSASPVAAKRRITVFDLLTHTAGIWYGTNTHVAAQYEAKGLGPAAGYGWYTADKEEPVCTTMERLASLPFVAQPGESVRLRLQHRRSWLHRGTGLGYAAGSVHRNAHHRTAGDEGHPVLPRTRAARSPGNGVWERRRWKNRPCARGRSGQGHYIDGPRKNFAGGAGLVSTARDYARFLEMIRRGGELDGVRVLAPRSVALMTTNQIGTLHSPAGLGFGLAFQTVDRYGANGLSSIGSYGWGGAYGTRYHVDPEARLTMVLMIQMLPNATDLREKFPNLVYQALIDTPDRPAKTSS